jgi:hypothetical protein
MIFKSLKTVVESTDQFSEFQEVALDFNLVESFHNDLVVTDIPQAMTPPEPEPVDVRPVAPEAPVYVAPEAPVYVAPLEIVQGQSVSVPNDIVTVEAPVVSTYYTEALSESFDSTPLVQGPVVEVIVSNSFTESFASGPTEQITDTNAEAVSSTPAPQVADALPEAHVAFDVVPPAPVEAQVNVQVPEAPVDIPVAVDNTVTVDNTVVLEAPVVVTLDNVSVNTEVSSVDLVVSDAPVQQYVEIAATPVYITPQVADASVDAPVQQYVEIAATPVYITPPDAVLKSDVIDFAKGDSAVAHSDPIICYLPWAKESAPQFSLEGVLAKGDAYVNSYVDSYVEVYSVRNDNDHLTKELTQVELVGVAQSTDVVADIAG